VLVSGVVKERAQVCKEVVVSFMDDKLMNMIDKEEIYNSLWPSQLKESPVGKPLAKIDLFHLERQLEKNPWVESANLYVDNRQTLKIDIKQRTPVARVFTPEGNSFYLDESFNLLPLKTTDFIALPVFMNFYIHPTALKASEQCIAFKNHWLVKIYSQCIRSGWHKLNLFTFNQIIVLKLPHK